MPNQKDVIRFYLRPVTVVIGFASSRNYSLRPKHIISIVLGNMLTNATVKHNPHYKQYVSSLVTDVKKTIYIDIHGTCQRILQYFEKEWKEVPYCLLLSSSYRKYSDFPAICRKAHDSGHLTNLVFDARGTPIEMLNYDVIGTLQDFNATGTVRDPPEYSVKWLEPYQIGIQWLLPQIKPWSSQDKEINLETLMTVIRRVYRVIQINRPILLKYIMHPGKHLVEDKKHK